MNKIKTYLYNFANKVPKIILILVILSGLSMNRGLLFGFTLEGGSKDDSGLEFSIPDQMVKTYLGGGEPMSTSSIDSVIFTVSSEDGDMLGYIFVSERFSDVSEGFGGPTPIAVFTDREGVVLGVEPLDNDETPRFVERVREDGFFDQWNGSKIGSPVQADAVSGATYTSRSLLANMEQLQAFVGESSFTPSGWGWGHYAGSVAVLLLAAAAILSMGYRSSGRQLRVMLLILSVVVLGVWQGAFVSLDLLYKWLISGASFVDKFAIITIVLLAFLVPLFTNRSFYCMYLCPFGAAQELIGRIYPKAHVSLPLRLLRVARWVRQIALMAIVVLLVLLPKFNLSDLEPFTIFMLRSASISVVLIGSLSLVASIFLPRAWCRLLCPTGEILNIMQRPLKRLKLNKKQ